MLLICSLVGIMGYWMSDYVINFVKLELFR